MHVKCCGQECSQHFVISSCSFHLHCTCLATKDVVIHSKLQPYDFTIESKQECSNTGINLKLILYLLEEAVFLCVILVLVFL